MPLTCCRGMKRERKKFTGSLWEEVFKLGCVEASGSQAKVEESRAS